MPANSAYSELDQSLKAMTDCFDQPILASSGYYLVCLYALNQSQNAPDIAQITQLIENPKSMCFYEDLDIDLSFPSASERLLQLSQLLLELNLHTNPIGFYLHLFPNLVCNQSSITEVFSDDYIKTSWLLHCVLDHFYTITSQADFNCDDEELFASSILSNCDPSEYYRSHSPTFQQMDVVASDFYLVWQACFISQIADRDIPFSIPALSDFFPAYRKHYSKLVPPTEFLEDYEIVHSGAKKHRLAKTHWEKILQNPKLNIKDPNYLQSLFALRNEPPISVIHTLLCPLSISESFSDDYGIEASFFLNTILSITHNAKNILVVHPTPFFVVAFKKTNLSKCATTFFMSDEVICRLMRDNAYPLHHYVSQLAEDSKFDIIVYFGNRGDDTPGTFVPFATENASILLFCPEVMFLTNTFLSGLTESRIQLQTITSIPASLCNAKPKKKVVALGCMTTETRSSEEIEFFYIKDLGNSTFYAKKHHFSLSIEDLFQSNTFLQLIKSKETPPEEIKPPKSESTQIYDFSREIKICYTLLPDRHNRYCARAFYRSVKNYLPKRSSEPIKNGKHARKSRVDRSLTPITERGLRAKSEGEVMERLELRVFEEDFYPVIMDDIIQNFQDQAEMLSLKTIWFLTFNTLRHTLTYNHEKALEVFCSKDSQSLSNLVPSRCDEHDFLSLIDESDHATWVLINSILSEAVKMRILSRNPIYFAAPVVEIRLFPEMKILRNQFINASFTWMQEQRIVNYICKINPATGYPKYVEDSQWLGIAIRLFTGMNTREVGALQWKQFVHVENLDFYQFYITQHLNDANIPISNAEFHNPKSHRKFPCSTLLSTILNQRLEYIKFTFSYSYEEIMNHPIVLKSEYSVTKKSTFTPKFSSRPSLRSTARTALSVAKIQEELVSISDHGNTTEVDLNKFSGDRFSAHFRSRAYHICGLSEGELCYICGIKATATVDENYADFSINLIQHKMVRALDKWTSVYTLPDIGVQTELSSTFTPTVQYLDTQIVIPPQNHTTQITLSSPYNFSGVVNTFSPEDL